jgi:hypothetical protein
VAHCYLSAPRCAVGAVEGAAIPFAYDLGNLKCGDLIAAGWNDSTPCSQVESLTATIDRDAYQRGLCLDGPRVPGAVCKAACEAAPSCAQTHALPDSIRNYYYCWGSCSGSASRNVPKYECSADAVDCAALAACWLAPMATGDAGEDATVQVDAAVTDAAVADATSSNPQDAGETSAPHEREGVASNGAGAATRPSPPDPSRAMAASSPPVSTATETASCQTGPRGEAAGNATLASFLLAIALASFRRRVRTMSWPSRGGE